MSELQLGESPDTEPREVVILDEAINRLPMDRIVNRDLVRIAEVWLGLPRAEGENLPRWASFSPQMVVRQLDKICILHVGQDLGDDIEFTLYGGHPTAHIGDGKPLVMQDLRTDPNRRNNYDDIKQRAHRAVSVGAPQFVRKTLSWDDCPDVEYEALMLPFMPEGGFSRVMQPVASSERPL